jgi:hypothetical protein
VKAVVYALSPALHMQHKREGKQNQKGIQRTKRQTEAAQRQTDGKRAAGGGGTQRVCMFADQSKA